MYLCINYYAIISIVYILNYEFVHGESGWRNFKKRDAKVKIKWLERLAFRKDVVLEIGWASLLEVGFEEG